MKTSLSCALAATLLFTTGCIQDIEAGNDGTGGTGGTTTDTGGSGGSGGENTGGSGGSGSMLVHTDLGQCARPELVEPLDHQILHQTNDGSIYSVIDFSACDPACGLWNAVLTDQTAYQPFVDIGFPAVDFTTHLVMISAGMDSASCTFNAGQSDPIVTLQDGVPHLEISYSFADTYSPPGCSSCAGVGLSAVAVQIPLPATTPTFCTHLTTGC